MPTFRTSVVIRVSAIAGIGVRSSVIWTRTPSCSTTADSGNGPGGGVSGGLATGSRWQSLGVGVAEPADDGAVLGEAIASGLGGVVVGTQSRARRRTRVRRELEASPTHDGPPRHGVMQIYSTRSGRQAVEIGSAARLPSLEMKRLLAGPFAAALSMLVFATPAFAHGDHDARPLARDLEAGPNVISLWQVYPDVGAAMTPHLIVMFDGSGRPAAADVTVDVNSTPMEVRPRPPRPTAGRPPRASRWATW